MAASSEILDIVIGRSMPEPNSGCWLWLGGCNPKGYGEYRASKFAPKQYAHRLAWEAANGPIPAGLWVLHKCDVASCCNPAHLYLGTHADNMRDMKERGRRKGKTAGERHARAKLTAEQVRDIRAMCGSDRVDLALTFGVSVSCVQHILDGRSWRHI